VKRALSLAVLVALTGCTAGAAPELRPAADAAVTGGVLRVGITQPGSVDPGNDYEPMGDLVLRTMCDPLIAADPRTGELEPALVQSWVVSDSGQRLVLRLRKGLRFSDGSPLTADDLVYSLSRIASADYASAAASQLSDIAGYDEVHGDAEADHDIDRRRMRGVHALDDQSVEITLVRRRADFLRVLTNRLVSPVPRSSATADPIAFARRPVCAGPYALDAPFAPGDRTLRLHRVDGYRGADSTLTRGGAGYVDAIEFRVYADAAAAAAAQRKGEVDVAPARPADRTDVQSGPGPLVEYLGLPSGTGPVFDQVGVRRALAMALDRQALVDAIFPGTRVPATGFLPPTTLPVFHADACGDRLPVRGDPVGARRELSAAGVDLTNVDVPLYVNDDGRNLALARAVAAQWKAAFGLTVRPRVSDFDTFLRRGTSSKGFDAPFRFSWATPYADPDGSLYPLFSSDRIGRDNMARFSDATIDRALVRQAREAVDADDRQVEYRRVERLLCEAMPMIPLTFSLSRYLVAPRISGSLIDRTSGQLVLREAYLGRR
jgi:ABC-type transport system substrate-binding protein